ncbi:MAG TPA: hypothetical protein VIR78_03685 [Malonomonas sp.]
MPIISCPHCGASRDMQQERLPDRTANARCPQCFKGFQFIPPEIKTSQPQQTDDTATVACPHCGLLRQLPGTRKPAPQATLSCRRCQQNFRLQDARKSSANPPENPKLMSIGSLLTSSWEQLCSRGWSLLLIYLLATLLIFAPLLLASMTLPGMVMGNQLLAWGSLLLGGTYGLFGLAWMTASLFQQLTNPQLGIPASLLQGWRTCGHFAWLLMLLSLTIGGGTLLLIIPGIVFSVWFSFSHYILAEDGIGGLAALQKSQLLVRGHWWPVCARILLLLLVAVAVTTLAGRLPLIGATINFVLTLLLVPFSLLYFQRLYENLKSCQPAASRQKPARHWLYLSLPTLGWLLIPGLLFFANSQNLPENLTLVDDSPSLFSDLPGGTLFVQENLLEEQEVAPQPSLPAALSATDYDRLLSSQQLVAPADKALSLGPATLQIGHFWAGPNNPQVWLTLKLAQLPNLDFSPRRAARILIDRVDDHSGRDLYQRDHSFESAPFTWVDILSGRNAAGDYAGIRNIQLQPGTQTEQLSSISGRLELQLPIGIESKTLSPADIGKVIQVASTNLTLEEVSGNRISLRVEGEATNLLDVRAFGQQAEPLREAGTSWQQNNGQTSLQQIFNGEVKSITVLVATETLTRSYPFDLSL